jgi:hypothetical protein
LRNARAGSGFGRGSTTAGRESLHRTNRSQHDRQFKPLTEQLGTGVDLGHVPANPWAKRQ